MTCGCQILFETYLMTCGCQIMFETYPMKCGCQIMFETYLRKCGCQIMFETYLMTCGCQIMFETYLMECDCQVIFNRRRNTRFLHVILTIIKKVKRREGPSNVGICTPLEMEMKDKQYNKTKNYRLVRSPKF